MVLYATTDNGVIVKVIADEQGDLKTQTFLEQQTTGQVKLGTAEAAAVQGLEAIPIADPNDRLGWLYVKGAADPKLKFNYFFYGQGNQSLALEDLTNLNAIITVDTYTDPNSLVFFNVYTQPTGSGDAGTPAFPFHSKITYSLTAGEHVVLGESIQAWAGTTKPINHPGKRFVEFNTKNVLGTGAPAELIWYITLHTDSAATVGTQILCQEVGYSALGVGISTIEPINVRLGLIG